VDAVTAALTVNVDNISSLLSQRNTSHTVVDVVLVASDDQNHSSAAQLTVYLADVNDNRPVFSASLQPYLAVIDENSLSFTRPVTVTVRLWQLD